MSSKKVPRNARPPSRGPRGGRPPKPPKFPKNAHGTCMVGELLVPLFGRRWVDKVAASGGLVPYLLRSVAAFLIPNPKRDLPALWRDTEAYR